MTTSSTPKFTNRIAQDESTTAGPFTEEQSHHSSTDFVAPFTRNLIPLSDEQGHDARQRHKTLQQVQGKTFSSSDVETAAAAAGSKTDVHTDSDIQQVGPQTLDPKAKSVLVRRSRKIEQVLGQTLTEPEAGRQVVDPVQRSEQAIVSHTQADWARREAIEIPSALWKMASTTVLQSRPKTISILLNQELTKTRLWIQLGMPFTASDRPYLGPRVKPTASLQKGTRTRQPVSTVRNLAMQLSKSESETRPGVPWTF